MVISNNLPILPSDYNKSKVTEVNTIVSDNKKIEEFFEKLADPKVPQELKNQFISEIIKLDSEKYLPKLIQFCKESRELTIYSEILNGILLSQELQGINPNESILHDLT